MTQTSNLPTTVTIDRITVLRAFDDAYDVDMDWTRVKQDTKLRIIFRLIGEEAYNSFFTEWQANMRAWMNMDCNYCQGCDNGDGCYREYESYTD